MTTITHRQREGYARSLEELLRLALQRTDRPKRDCAITLHADFVHSPEAMEEMVKRLESGAGLVVGELLPERGGAPRPPPAARRAPPPAPPPGPPGPPFGLRARPAGDRGGAPRRSRLAAVRLRAARPIRLHGPDPRERLQRRRRATRARRPVPRGRALHLQRQVWALQRRRGDAAGRRHRYAARQRDGAPAL